MIEPIVDTGALMTRVTYIQSRQCKSYEKWITYGRTQKSQKTTLGFVELLLWLCLDMEGSLKSLLVCTGFYLDLIFGNDLFNNFAEGSWFTILASVTQVNGRQSEWVDKDWRLVNAGFDTRACSCSPYWGGIGSWSSGSERGKSCFISGIQGRNVLRPRLCGSRLKQRRERIRGPLELMSLLKIRSKVRSIQIKGRLASNLEVSCG